MATPVPNYYADTSINGSVIGEQEIRLFPLINSIINSVISSEPLILISNAAAIPISKSYLLTYENGELGPVFNKDNIKRNEILNLNITPVVYPTASVLVSKYYLPYDNGEIGPVPDKTGIYRNTILNLNNQDAYRYLVQNSSGSNYPVDNIYDPNYKNTKVVLNFDSLSNQAFTNLSLLSSGSFTINTGPTPNTSSYITNSIQVLVVAGGGGGGMDIGGGGGGGGVVYNSSYTATSGSIINVTVGNGGSGAPAGGTSGQPGNHQFTVSATQGGNSVFGSITAIGGGYGGSSYFQYGPNNGYGGSGGSGGGASGYSDGNTGRNGTGSAGQGFSGGGSSGQYYSGGGGGAGGVGSSGPNIPHGGPGLLFSAMSPYYFGGGGGGAAHSVSPGGDGGIGGGGGGAVGVTVGGTGLNNGSPGGGGGPNVQANTPGGNAGANTGGGGGGSSHYNSNNKGGNGGSGIVIVRYYGSQKATGGTVTSVNGNTIHTLTGSATMSFYDNPATDPVVGGYGYFDGSGSYVRISGSSLLNLGSGSVFESPFTVEYDFYTNSSSKYQTILSRGAGSINYNTSSGLVYNAGISSSKIIWEYYTNNTSSYLLTGSTNIVDNNWYSYAVTYDGNITRLYLNGVLENSVSNSIYNYPSTLLSSLTSSFIGRLVNTSSNDFSGYLDKFRITTGIARYTSTTYVVQSSSYPISAGVLIGVNYCNSNILNIRFVSSSISASNLILPSGTNDLTASQDILVTNISKNTDNYLINTISTGSNLIKRNDGIVDKTVYTSDLYLSSTDIIAVGSVNNVINTISSGSNLIKGTDGMVNNTVYTGDSYLSNTIINTTGLIKRTILLGAETTITTNTYEFIPSVSKTYTYEMDYNAVFNQEIDSILVIVKTYNLPAGFNISTNGKSIIGYVNFTTAKTIIVKLSDETTYNIIIKPIFFKKKYTY